jgi:hypothetical protein
MFFEKPNSAKMKPAVFYMCFVVIMGMVSCSVNYSFTGASIPPGAKTVSVEYFKYNAQNFNATLSQEFTEALRDKMISQTTLNLIDGKGDLQFKGQITGYEVRPAALSANETAPTNRLTVQVKIEFINEFDESANFEQTFSRYADFPSSMILTEAEPTYIPEIIKQLIDDIFQKAVVNW